MARHARQQAHHSRTGGHDRSIPSRFDDCSRATAETDHVQAGEHRFLLSGAQPSCGGQWRATSRLGRRGGRRDGSPPCGTSGFKRHPLSTALLPSVGSRLCRFRRHGVQRLLGCGRCELRIHPYLAQKLGYRGLHLGFSCGRQARYAPDGAFIRDHRKSLETEPFKLSSELSILRHPQRLGLPRECL